MPVPSPRSPVRTPIRELLEQLDPEVFWQIHRGTAVNVKALERGRRSLAGNCALRRRQRPRVLPVGTTCARLFRRM